MDIKQQKFHRYAKQMALPEVDEEGQKKISLSKVLVVGAGGLGSPVIQYLVGAGIGTIGVIDDDIVELSNLHRQIIHTSYNIGESKVESAKKFASSLNPLVKIIKHETRLNLQNIREIIKKYDIVADGSDNFETRFLLNDFCFFEKKTLVSAAVIRFDGQVSTYKPYQNGPCYRCLNPDTPEEDIWNCEQSGIMGPVAGMIGAIQCLEIIKEILNIGKSLSGSLLIYDGLDNSIRIIKLKPDPKCPLCSNFATIQNPKL